MNSICEHLHRKTIYSPDETGYYVQCLDCWITGPLKKTRRDANEAFYKQESPKLLKAKYGI